MRVPLHLALVGGWLSLSFGAIAPHAVEAQTGCLLSERPMVFGHVVYSWICKHLYLFARSRRTSGPLWRRVSGPRPPYRTPLPNPPCQCRGAVDHDDCARPTLHRSDRPQCAACVPPARARGAAAAIVTPPYPRHDLSPWRLRGCAGAVAPEPPHVRQADELVDPRPGCRGQLRLGAHTPARQRRSYSGGPPPPAGVVEAGQTLAHQSRSGVCPQKKRRDQLIQRAMAQLTWTLGLGDEVWWSLLAQPNQHSWTDAAATYKLQELSRRTEDLDPKALVCDGLRRRPDRCRPTRCGPAL